ncbi:hypothetical protein MPER_12748 [Moniliophthora perniciosa FA553]|nr:hypothetical protein MPER_12748 [Moniliophthora perniciosa FA553]
MNIPVEQEDIIVEIPLDKLQGSILDIGPTATRKHLRMIDCNAFLDSQVLRIRQFQEHAPTSYSTVSYIWKGNGLGSTPDLQPRLFSVNGAEDGDPISINVLRDACLVSVHFDVPYLWLDQLCIMQTDKVDKNWQIVQMSQLYRGTTVCIVLPGGLQRLVPLDEETAWMHRAWTLQEAFLPKKTFVVFPWQKGEGKIYTQDDNS